MSRRVACHLFDGLCGGNKKRKGGIYSEGKVVIENANISTSLSACFYDLDGTIISPELSLSRKGGLFHALRAGYKAPR